MNILVFGAGAIGCHIAYCMNKTGHSVHLIGRSEHFNQMKKNGMKIQIFNNNILESESVIHESNNFIILDNVNKINNVVFDYVFITVKLADYNERVLKSLQPFFDKDTAIIPPCTKIPFWWFFNFVGKYRNIDFDPGISKYFKRENIIMMTMWLSAVVDKPGHIIIKHTQRGYPLGPVYPRMESRSKKLRGIFQETCVSPDIDDIRSEIYIKSINSLAFNAVALDKEFNNLQLSQDEDSKNSIKKIMLEGEQILDVLNMQVVQDVDDRIKQTLSSKNHTMSMLHDYQNGKQVELSYIWDGFCKICNVLDINMSFTKAVVERVLYKVNSNLDNDNDLS